MQIVEFAQAEAVFAAEAGRPKVEAPLVKLNPKSAKIQKKLDLGVVDSLCCSVGCYGKVSFSGEVSWWCEAPVVRRWLVEPDV